jgi:hypothetical protein
MPKPDRLPIVQIDASNLSAIGEVLHQSIGTTARRAQWVMSRGANELANRLGEAAPKSSGRPDPRRPDPLWKSFRMRRVADGGREIYTTEAQKYAFTNFGARAPTNDSGYIFPRIKKAIYIPGTAHPVWWAGPPYSALIPRTRGTMWAEKVMWRFMYGGAIEKNSLDWSSVNIIDWYVATLTNLINRVGRVTRLNKSTGATYDVDMGIGAQGADLLGNSIGPGYDYEGDIP